MIFDKMFTQNAILETAMQASQYKSQVIMNNLANVDTPGFKAKEVEFEGILRSAIDSAKMTGNLDINSVMPSLYTQHGNYKVRIDKNNLDVETELVKFYKNSSKYDVITNSALNNSSRLNTVLTNTK